MKKAQVKVGVTYTVRVSGVLVPVKLLNESRYGGWDGINVTTGRAVRIKTAGRLRGVHPSFSAQAVKVRERQDQDHNVDVLRQTEPAAPVGPIGRATTVVEAIGDLAKYGVITPEQFGEISVRAIHLRIGTGMSGKQDITQHLQGQYPDLHPDDVADVVETALEGWDRLMEQIPGEDEPREDEPICPQCGESTRTDLSSGNIDCPSCGWTRDMIERTRKPEDASGDEYEPQ